MGQVLLLSKNTITKTTGRRVTNSRTRAQTIQFFRAMVKERGWDDYKLRKALEKRGIYALPYFPDDGLELTLHLPSKHYKKKDFYRIFIRMKLAKKCTHFEASLIVQIAHASEERRLHKPIRVPVVSTLKAQIEEVIKAYQALYDGIFCIVGPEALPEWPSNEELKRMNERAVLRAKQTLNHIATLRETEAEFEDAFGRNRDIVLSKNVVSIEHKG